MGREQNQSQNGSALIAQAQRTVKRSRRIHSVTEVLLSSNDTIRFTLLITDLELGITFAAIASQAYLGWDTKTRNAANARTAFESVSRLSRRALLKEEEQEAVDGKLAQLRSALEQQEALFP